MHFVFTRMLGESYRRMYLWWSLCTLYLHACQVRVTVDVSLVEFMYLVFNACQVRVTVGVPLVEFMYLVFTRISGESYCRRL